jgi:hypothetical protein
LIGEEDDRRTIAIGIELSYDYCMVFDEEAANRVVRDLAAITDAQQVSEIVAAVAQALAAWRRWRADPVYPPPGAVDRAIQDRHERTVTAVAKAYAQLPVEADLRAAVSMARGLLGDYISDRGGTAGFAEAVDRLRWLAIHRPRLVDDARRMVAQGMA